MRGAVTFLKSSTKYFPKKRKSICIEKEHLYFLNTQATTLAENSVVGQCLLFLRPAADERKKVPTPTNVPYCCVLYYGALSIFLASEGRRDKSGVKKCLRRTTRAHDNEERGRGYEKKGFLAR